jgi:heme/copper-type cytochrome/quinol oxidase subunit 4
MQGISKPGHRAARKRLESHLAYIISGCFMVALTAVCFLGPALDAFDKWMEADIMHSVYVFLIPTGVLAVYFIWLKTRD